MIKRKGNLLIYKERMEIEYLLQSVECTWQKETKSSLYARCKIKK